MDAIRWDVSPSEARSIQAELRHRIVLDDRVALDDIRIVAGVDNAYLRRGAVTTACGVAVNLSFPALDLLTTSRVTAPVTFPYVPGLLAFREVPTMLAAVEGLEVRPDVVLVDAHGYAHPRRMGAATHLGLLLDRPTIGCAKSRLIGQYDEPGPEFGARAPLVHRGEVVGAVVRTRAGRAPLFVSAGHLIGLETAVRVVLACARGRSIMPEPTRIADALTKEEARRERERLADPADRPDQPA